MRAEEEQITAARAKQHEDEEEDTGIRPKKTKDKNYGREIKEGWGIYKHSTIIYIVHHGPFFSAKKTRTKKRQREIYGNRYTEISVERTLPRYQFGHQYKDRLQSDVV